ncbi:hypothetical protein KCU77_g5379, partial [Aureobasidium melanogenum]
MSILTTKQDLPDPIDKSCLDLSDENSRNKFREDLQALQKRMDPVLDTQAREMDFIDFINRIVMEMEKCAKSINDQSSDEVDKAISASLSVADKVFKKTKRDVNKIGNLTDNVKRDRTVAIILKDLDAGMLEVTAPILSLPRSNVFRETVIRCSLPKFENMRDVLSTKVRKAHESATQKHQTRAGHSCVVA